MVILQYLSLAVEVLVSLLLLLVILVQRTKSGGGMGAALGGGFGESVFGSRAGNVLTKATVVLSTVFLLNTLALTLLFSQASGTRDLIQEPPPSSLPTSAPAGSGTAPPDTAPPPPAVPEAP